MIVVGQVVGAQRSVVGLKDAVEYGGIETAKGKVHVDIACETSKRGVTRFEHFVETL